MLDRENRHGYSVQGQKEIDETKESKTEVRVGITIQWLSPTEKQFFY